jgi:hypothetical protein
MLFSGFLTRTVYFCKLASSLKYSVRVTKLEDFDFRFFDPNRIFLQARTARVKQLEDFAFRLFDPNRIFLQARAR